MSSGNGRKKTTTEWGWKQSILRKSLPNVERNYLKMLHNVTCWKDILNFGLIKSITIGLKYMVIESRFILPSDHASGVVHTPQKKCIW